MKVNGSGTVGLTREQAWSLLADPERLGGALPNVEHVTADGPGSCRVRYRLETGLGTTPLDLTLRVTDQREHEHARIQVGGWTGTNRVDGEIDLDLVPDGEATTVRWVAEVRALGVLGSVGQHVAAALLRDEIEQGLRAAERSVATAG